MKQVTVTVLWATLLVLQPSVSGEDSLQYILRTIDYLISVKPGVFSVVFYDAAGPDDSRDGIFDNLVKSPRLNHVVKFVIGGSYRGEFDKLPTDPTIVVLNAGNDSKYLQSNETVTSMKSTLNLFSSTTRLLVFVDQSSQAAVQETIYWSSYTASVFMDSATQYVRFCNGLFCWNWPGLGHPMYLFDAGFRAMRGRNISYTGRGNFGFYWNVHWLKETARYLRTDVVEIEHNCTEPRSGSLLYKCLKELEVKIGLKIDVTFNYVWALLLTILVSSEFVRHLCPTHFNNDPILLVVCGFERRNLHQAGRLEKICFLSMIILMFFMSSAFETKILSLMASKPAIQRIKTLADLLKSDVKFYFDVEANPHYKERMIIGDRIFQGDELIHSETIPGVGTLCRKEFVQLLEQIAFDYERNQPFYVVLDYEYYDSPECIDTVWRFIYRQTFITMHGWLVQAGLMEKWKQQWMDKMRSEHIGRRYREDTRFKADLSFDDIKPAWVLLMAGLGISLVTVLAEHGKHVH
ncbi:conserved hypothetical protein [Culex quinquefasciatus]|uniref:Ionotropic glutamate receptor L-glutamate and glycine-binding domain-containing protein n=1 Tax=Culex quinquefasciatus TaxID=7176 RepID=B0WKG4_CULQU|nr:conserved hypothetical protein [Culex quinquefasciatus]|eukprot:XP_001849198.1 conserved hypothetical protein [Culex quinquefasciatus]